jgi:hypothetical protein
MVQKYQSPVRVYKYPFELVMAVSMQLLLLCLSANALFVSQLFISEGTSYRGLVGLLLMFPCYINVNCRSDLRCFLFFV